MLRDRYAPMNLFDLVPAFGMELDPVLIQLDRLLDDLISPQTPRFALAAQLLQMVYSNKL